MRQGDDTFDVPTITGPGVSDPAAMKADARTALAFCLDFIEANGTPVTVRVAMNPHDFGSYPSLELDYQWPSFGHDCEGGDCSDCEASDAAMDKVNALDKAFRERFKDSL